MGPITVLTKAEEAMLAAAGIHYQVSEMQLPHKNRQDLCDIVAKVVKADKRRNLFKDGRPGYCWFQGKKGVEKGKGKKGDEKEEKRAEKQGMKRSKRRR